MSGIRMVRRRLVLIAVAISTLALFSCATRPEIDRAPLAEAGQKKLRQALVGSWQHTVTVREGGGRKPLEDATVVWTFQEDGTGTYRKEPTGDGSKIERDFRWRLEGRNLFIEMKETRDAYFRAETWSPRQMRWHNYRTEQIHLLKRASTDTSTPNEETPRRDRSTPSGGSRRTR